MATRYEAFVGRRVAVEGFLIFFDGRMRMLPGSPLSATEARAHHEASNGYWCTFEDQPNPLAIAGLPRTDLRRIAPRVRNRPVGDNLEGQRVRLEGVARAPLSEPEREAAAMIGVIDLGPLDDARLTRIDDIFCVGHQASDRLPG